MNGTVIFGVVIIFFIITALTNFITELNDEVDTRSNYPTNKELKSEDYYGVDVVGETTLRLNSLSELKKKEVWDNSTLKVEMMEFFPDFSLMSELVENRLIDESSFKKRLLKKIETTEEKYIGGVISGERAKSALNSF